MAFADEWLELALADLETAKRLRDLGEYPLACWHCHQAAEKALKWRLCSHNIGGDHAISVLVKALGCDDDLELRGLSWLDHYYYLGRYPGTLPEGAILSDVVGRQEADKAIEIANRVSRRLCEQGMKVSPSPTDKG